MKPVRILGASLLVVATWRGTPAVAQVSVAADAGLFSSYVWRGLTFTNNLVIEPEASITMPVKGASLTAELWSNIEPGRYNGFSDISEGGGAARFDVTEISWDGSLAVSASKRATLTLGAAGYIFPNNAGFTSSENTVEIYGRADLATALNPTASVYYDVGVIKGAYFEGGISHVFAKDARAPLTVGAAAGLCAGQDADLDASGAPRAESFNFNKNGFTHADVWATTDVTAGKFTISPTLHVIVTGDDATRVSKIERDPSSGAPRFNSTGTKLWFGITLGWAR